jgi:hypothetical protein
MLRDMKKKRLLLIELVAAAYLFPVFMVSS